MSTKIDPKKFDKLLGDFTEALKLRRSALGALDESNENFYLRKSYRYINNDTLGFFSITLGEDYVEVAVDSTKGRCKVYSWHDEETFKVLRPLIHKALKARFEELEGQVVYQDDDTYIVLRPDTGGKELCLFIRYKGEDYYAEADGSVVRLSCNGMSPDALIVYMHAVEKYLVPRAKRKKCTKGKRHA